MMITRMPFGRYQGQLLADLPLHYLRAVLRLPGLDAELRAAIIGEIDQRLEERNGPIKIKSPVTALSQQAIRQTIYAWLKAEERIASNEWFREPLLAAQQRLYLLFDDQFEQWSLDEAIAYWYGKRLSLRF